MRCDIALWKLVHARYYFNPRTSCEVRHAGWASTFGTGAISIHAPRVRCDTIGNIAIINILIFQSTHLVWGATWVISRISMGMTYFNPRTSCEVRRYKNLLIEEIDLFQSTHLVWGATPKLHKNIKQLVISIHAPRVRCDSEPMDYRVLCYISIHAPRVRCDILLIQKSRCNIVISIHAPRVRCDNIFSSFHKALIYFNPRTSCEVRPRQFY